MMRQPKRSNSISRRSGDWGSIHIQAYIYTMHRFVLTQFAWHTSKAGPEMSSCSPWNAFGHHFMIFLLLCFFWYISSSSNHVFQFCWPHNITATSTIIFFFFSIALFIELSTCGSTHCACTVEKVWIPKTHGDLTSMNVRNIPLVISCSHSIIWSNSIIGLFINCSTNDVS